MAAMWTLLLFASNCSLSIPKEDEQYGVIVNCGLRSYLEHKRALSEGFYFCNKIKRKKGREEERKSS